MQVIRDFSYKGYKFHLNDNRKGISKTNYEFFPKYKLLLFDIDRWVQIACVDTKQEGKAFARRYYLEVLRFD